MTHLNRWLGAAGLVMALTGLAVSALAQQAPADAVSRTERAAAAPNYKTARDIFLKTKKFKTPAEQLSRAKEFLTALTSGAENRLADLKERLAASDLPQTLKDSSAAEIDKAVNALTALNADIAGAATRAELAKVSIKAKDALQLARFTLKRQIIAFKLQRLGVVAERLQTVLEQAETALNDLKIANPGLDTASTAAELADIKNKLSTIQTSRRNAESAIEGLSVDKDFAATTDSADSVAAKMALNLQTILSSARSLVAEVKALTPPPAAPNVQPPTNASTPNP